MKNNNFKRKFLALLLASITGLTACAKNNSPSKEDDKSNNIPYSSEAPSPTNFLVTPNPTPLMVTETPILQTSIPVKKNDLVNYGGYKILKGNYVNMRLDANIESLSLGKVNKGKKVYCIAEYKDWSLVQVDNIICFIKSEFLNETGEFISTYSLEENLDIVYTTTDINFRLSPEVANENKIGGIPKNGEVEVFGKTSNNWYLAKYDGKIGYISAEYTTSLKEKIHYLYPEIESLKVQKIVSLITDTNLLESPKNSGKIIKNLEIYQSAEVLDISSGYYLVKVDKNIGYIPINTAKTLSNICIIIDISDQTLKVYVNNDVAVVTLVSTGKKGYETPIGLLNLRSKEQGRYLIGNDYKVWVDYAMHVVGGIWEFHIVMAV